ncbi:UNVERIFIED_CONTAM: hypothetical protein FKN15_022055 [Acipenser sinensis]
MPQRVFALPRQESLFPPAVLNPFVQEIQLTTADKIRLLLVGSVLVPLRVLCLTVLLVLSWPLAAIATLCGPNKGTRQPIKGWRSCISVQKLTADVWLKKKKKRKRYEKSRKLTYLIGAE